MEKESPRQWPNIHWSERAQARVAQLLRWAKMSTKQTDEEFVAACGLSGSIEASKIAIDLRNRLAEYGKVASSSLTSETKIIDTGLIHPADSIDLIEFTFQMEDILGKELNEADFQPMVAAGSEEMTIRQWVGFVLKLRNKHMHNNPVEPTSAPEGARGSP